MRYIQILLLLAGPPWVGAQQAIEGMLVDPAGWPIRGARVRCGESEMLSGLDGRFTFPVTRCELRVAAEGFSPHQVTITAGEFVRIGMSLAGLVETITVTATRDPTTLEKAGVAGEVIAQREAERRGFPMLGDLLRDVPGVHVNRTGRHGGLTTVLTRGAQRTGTLVLLDGVPLNDPGGELNLAHVTTSELARIEVVRTPESALFGSEASTAVIQLFTRRGDPERRVPRGSLIYERGNFSTDRWLARAGGGAGSRLDYGLTAEQFRTSGEFENDTYRATTGAANAGIRLSPSTALRGVLRGQDTWLGVPGQVTYGFIDRDAHQTTRDWTGSLRLEDVRGARFVQRAMLGIHRLRDIYTDLGFDGPYTVAMLVRDIPGPVRRVQRVALLDPALAPLIIPSPGTRLVTRTSTLFPGDEPFLHRISRTNFDYQGTFSQDAATTTLGYEYDRQGGTISASEAVRNHHGVFAHHHHTLGRLSLSAGLRAEHSSEFGGKLAPRASASVRVMGERGSHSSTIFRISAARGITEPSLLQNFAREAFFQGNPDLRPEKTTSYDAGLVQEWFGRRVRSEISVFHSSFKDLIAFVSLPPPVWGSWENIEASKARGLEFSGLARVFGPVQVRGAYTRLYTRIVSSGNPASLVNGIGQELTRRPRNSGSVSLLIAPGRWWLQAGAQFVGERQDSDFIASNRNPGYQNVWAGASLDANQHISPFLRLDNALNSRFEEALGYSNLSRSIRGGLRLSW